MRLEHLSIEQFRNYPRLALEVGSHDLHLFIGPNGSGKTNLLEAICVLSLTQSCRDAEESDLPHWGTGFFRVRGRAETDGGEERRLEVVGELAPRRRKACFVNDVRVSTTDMVGQLPSVAFLPEDLSLFSGPPAERRRFLDQLLCQVSPEYVRSLSEYNRILKQRNALLRAVSEGQSPREELPAWDRELAKAGSRVTIGRLELVETLGLTLGKELSTLGETMTDASLAYERKGAERDLAALERELLGLLAAAADKDILLQSTSIGPHRDDWHVVADGRRLQTFASRGQQRTVMIALLFLQVSYLELRRGEKPVVLLDDVFSELDDRHQSRLVESLAGHQVFLTGTHLPPILAGGKVWDVRAGEVAEKGA